MFNFKTGFKVDDNPTIILLCIDGECLDYCLGQETVGHFFCTCASMALSPSSRDIVSVLLKTIKYENILQTILRAVIKFLRSWFLRESSQP